MKKILSCLIACALAASTVISPAAGAAENDADIYTAKLRELATKGNADAQTSLAVSLYERGMHGSQADASEAVSWLRKAVAQGQPVAEFYLGAAYNTGTGVAKDPDQGLKWIQKSAEHGYLNGQASMGNHYFSKGEGFLCYLWTNYAASRGHHGAIQDRQLIESYLTPDQIKAAHALVSSWAPGKPAPPAPSFNFLILSEIAHSPMDRLRAAAEAGNTGAQLQLSYELERMPAGKEEARKWLTRAAEGGNAGAQNTLALKLSQEPGKETQVAAWKAKAKDQERKNAEAYLEAQAFADTGSNTPDDPVMAVKTWKQLAEKDHNRTAMYNLGLAYYKGRGVAKDLIQSNFWLTLAVAHLDWQASLEALTNIRTMISETQTMEGKEQARKWIAEHPMPAPTSNDAK